MTPRTSVDMTQMLRQQRSSLDLNSHNSNLLDVPNPGDNTNNANTGNVKQGNVSSAGTGASVLEQAHAMYHSSSNLHHRHLVGHGRSVCVCVYVSVCDRERERQRDREFICGHGLACGEKERAVYFRGSKVHCRRDQSVAEC